MRTVPLLLALAMALGAAGDPLVHHRALLIGINDYTASRLGPPPKPGQVPDRDWTDLTGAVNDVHAFAEVLHNLYGFDRSDIITLTDQDATRERILAAIQMELVDKAGKGDVLFFYYAGHGSQVRNSYSDEIDKLDESIVPADTRFGVRDIRDKELRATFNAIVDRGAKLTVILDSCHSGSGARGLSTGAHARGVTADQNDVKDRIYGPRPEDRGAIVMTAAHDSDIAWETRDKDGDFHGAFSWAFLRALRDAPAGEPLTQTFARAQARMRGESPFQDPVLAGRMNDRIRPFLGTRIDREDDRVVVAVEKTLPNGNVVLQGGWANGLTVGSELQLTGSPARLTVASIRGICQSEATVTGGPVPAGALATVTRWVAPSARPLRVWMPATSLTSKDIAAFARGVYERARESSVEWIASPIDKTPKHILRHSPQGWELSKDGEFSLIGSDEKALEAVSALPRGSTLFLQLPAPAALVRELDVASRGVSAASSAADADYILAGRYASRGLSYAWLRPAVKRGDHRSTELPLATRWTAVTKSEAQLGARLDRLRKIHMWQSLESPPGARFPYQIALRHARSGDMPRKQSMAMKERYRVVLRATLPFPSNLQRRYVYVFVIDSDGKSTLLYPNVSAGSAENRFPLDPKSPPTEIDLGEESAFEVGYPRGVDAFYLLATDEPLRNSAVLEWDGVRSPFTPQAWSLDRVLYETVSTHATKDAD